VKDGPDDDLIRSAARLRHTAPREWDNFMTALVLHTERMRDDVVRCAPEVVLSVQGRAKHAADFLTLMGNCDELAQKLEARSK